jgi:hypothetical protein
MTDTHDELNALRRSELVFQWLLAAVTNDRDMLDELQDVTELSCRCCVAAVARVLAQFAAYFSVELRGHEGAERDAERLLADCLDDIAELEAAP